MTKFTKIIYIILFVALLVHPHFIAGHIFFIPSAYAQSIVNLLILGMAYFIYHSHQKGLREKEVIGKELEATSEKLNDAFKYIGIANRHLPLLNKLTTDILKSKTRYKKDKKNIFYNLSTIAIASIAQANWGIFRFIDKKTGKTVKEIIYSNKKYMLLKTQISNKKLLKATEQNLTLIEEKDLYSIPTSDQEADIQCFLIYPREKEINKDTFSVLKNIVDQAQLLYQYLYQPNLTKF